MTSTNHGAAPPPPRYSDPADKPYFYGRLLREEANRILEKKGGHDGLFLLRESVFEVGAYILSLCHQRQIQHYKIERHHEDGTVGIGRTGHRFAGPVELIRHHQREAAGDGGGGRGLITRPSSPCDRSDDNVTVQPIKYLFIHDVDLYKLVSQEIQRAMSLRLKTAKHITKQKYDQELEDAKGRFRYKYEKIVAKNIHFTQAWFRKDLNREEATRLLRESGLEDGKFLVRSSNSSNSSAETTDKSQQACLEYKISLCFNGDVKHYQIKTKYFRVAGDENLIVSSQQQLQSPLECRYYIDDSFEFDTIIQLVDYFHRSSVGFLCNLRVAYLPPPVSSSSSTSSSSSNSSADGSGESTSALLASGERDRDSGSMANDKCVNGPTSIYNSNRMYNAVLNDITTKSGTINYIDDEPNQSGDIANLAHIPEKKRPLFENEENYEYNSLDRYSKLNTIDHRNLAVFDKLGTGCFASVYRGIYKVRDGAGDSAMQEIPVAIKKLNMENLDESRREIEKEAELMRSLNNPFIVKFIGMCFNYQNSSIMIVLELAKLGPLHKYLRAHQEMSMFKIVKICYQVAIAMSYLAEKKLIHRDLAARNVLLVTEDIAKVSDFGLSRKMNEFNCYETHAHGKWPLKWYPPDATLGKFDEKSDVWSFGVTCWEATSYGARPYQGIEIASLILSLQNGHRLGKPSKCPDEIYNVMLMCWHADKHSRPYFKMLKEELKQTIFDLYQTYINYH